jgi:hypothetical protein
LDRLFTIRYDLAKLAVAFFPILIYLFLRGDRCIKKHILYILGILMLLCMEFQMTKIVTSRIILSLAMFLSVVLGHFVTGQLKRFRAQHIVWFPVLLLPCFFTHTFYGIDHIPSVKKAFPAFFSEMKKLGGNMILVENQSAWNLIPDAKVRSERQFLKAHWESLLSHALDRKLFCTTMEGHHFSVYRGNTINSGTFRGKPIENHPVQAINQVLKKWGIAYLAVWSQRSVNYFLKAELNYKLAWKKGRWHIFQFLDADPRSVHLQQGEANVVDQDYFKKKLILKNVCAGDTAVVRQNYFPSWQVHHNAGKMDLVNVNGQMGIILPADGNYSLDLYFPKYHIFSIVAVLAVILSFITFRLDILTGRFK